MTKACNRPMAFIFIFFTIFLHFGVAFGWHDETHLAVARAAGYGKWYNCAGADITKIKAGEVEKHNHYFNNNAGIEVTPRLVQDQAGRYNDPADTEGHLYGAIIASLREYMESEQTGKYSEYHVAFCAHYLGDLSQPFHNTPYDLFSLVHHVINDGIVEQEVLENLNKIKENMYVITLNSEDFEKSLSVEISRIADLARQLGYKLRKEDRDMTREEAYSELGHSASLLRAILRHLGKIN